MTTLIVLLYTLLVVTAHVIVQLSTEVTAATFLERHPFLLDGITKTFSIGSFRGFAGNFDFESIKFLSTNPLVVKLTPDTPVSIGDLETETRESAPGSIVVEESRQDGLPTLYKQLNAPRHLARMNRRTRLGEGNEGEYWYYTQGQGDVDVYVIDTGAYAEHAEFEGRIKKRIDFTGEGVGDRNGHGTHVAGLVGSRTYGSAKNVSLVEIKVLTGTGTGNLSAVIAGIEYAANARKESGRKSVANLSLGAGFNSLLNSAVNAAVDSGLPMVVAAGNANTAACASSPASSVRALTVGAIDDRYDTIATFSNWGSCVDVFASGVIVESLSHQGSSTVALSGTSMAAPTVAGIMAMYMGLGEEEYKAATRIMALSTANAIEKRSVLFRPRTPNRLAFSGVGVDDEHSEPMSEENREFRLDLRKKIEEWTAVTSSISL